MAHEIANLVDVAKVREIVRDDDPTTWDIVWKAKIIPWDAGDIQPPLRELVESGQMDFPRKGRALVPGCGSGNDAIYIASTLNLDTLGLDISETAVSLARENLASKAISPTPSVHFSTGDFFTLKVPEDEKVDLIYDYTFFIAIPPSRRVSWGQQMANLIKPGGYLITLMFPVGEPSDVGPPWVVQPRFYHEVLDGNFVKVLDKVPESSIGRHVGMDRIAVWRRS